MVIPSTPGLPLLLRTRFHAPTRFSRSHTSSISCSAQAGRSGAGFATGGSVPWCPRPGASPRPSGTKASEYWIFCRVPLMSCQSYLPLSIVRAFGRKRSVNADRRNDRRMAEQAEQVSTTGLVDTKQPKRRQYSEALKRQMVAETQAPGASVSIVARRHDVNSNQLFRWRRQLLPKAVVESGAMVPVEIAADGDRLRRPDRDGVIEITFGCGARVRLRGEVSPETLRQVVELLR